MFRFEKFDVWHKAVAFTSTVYSATSHFPRDERFGLTSQMRRRRYRSHRILRKAVRVPSDADFARFVGIAYGSLMESVSQSVIANQQAFLHETRFRELYASAEEVARMLSGLRGRLVSS